MKRKPFPKKFRPNVDRGQVWRAHNGRYIWITGAVYDEKKHKFRTDAFYGIDMERGTQYVIGLDGLPFTEPGEGGMECWSITDEGKCIQEYVVRLTTFLGAMEPPRFVGNEDAQQMAIHRQNLRHEDAIQNLANWHGHPDAQERRAGSVAEFNNHYHAALIAEHNEREDKRIENVRLGIHDGK